MGGLSAVLIYVLKIILIFTSFCLISVLKKVSEMSPPKKSLRNILVGASQRHHMRLTVVFPRANGLR